MGSASGQPPPQEARPLLPSHPLGECLASLAVGRWGTAPLPTTEDSCACPVQALGWGPTRGLSALAPSSVTGAHTSASLSLSFSICKTEKNHGTPSPLPLATRYGPASASGGSLAGLPSKVEGAVCARLQKAAWPRSRGPM